MRRYRRLTLENKFDDFMYQHEDLIVPLGLTAIILFAFMIPCCIGICFGFPEAQDTEVQQFEELQVEQL